MQNVIFRQRFLLTSFGAPRAQSPRVLCAKPGGGLKSAALLLLLPVGAALALLLLLPVGLVALAKAAFAFAFPMMSKDRIKSPACSPLGAAGGCGGLAFRCSDLDACVQKNQTSPYPSQDM